MSGTSMDAIDAAMVRFDTEELELVEYDQYPIDESIRSPVRKLSIESDGAEINKFDRLLGGLFAVAVNNIVDKAKVPREDIVAIGSHGQTIIHLPHAHLPRTVQIGDAHIIANNTGITTIADFRRMDMEAGGQGAPLAPALHADLFRSDTVNRCILNLGGIANITILPADQHSVVTGFDTGPANCLLDDWNRLHNNTQMDVDGNWASQGTPDADLLARLLADPYFKKAVPKSTGRDDFNLHWLYRNINALNKPIAPVNVQATLLMLTITSIINAINNQPLAINELYLCGGGSHNAALVNGLSGLLQELHIASTAKLGMNPDAVEAVTFAWLAKRRLEGKPGNLPSVTGAKKPVLLGTIFKPGVIGN